MHSNFVFFVHKTTAKWGVGAHLLLTACTFHKFHSIGPGRFFPSWGGLYNFLPSSKCKFVGEKCTWTANGVYMYNEL